MRTFHLIQTELLAAEQDLLRGKTETQISIEELFRDVAGCSSCHFFFLVVVCITVVGLKLLDQSVDILILFILGSAILCGKRLLGMSKMVRAPDLLVLAEVSYLFKKSLLWFICTHLSHGSSGSLPWEALWFYHSWVVATLQLWQCMRRCVAGILAECRRDFGGFYARTRKS